MKHFCSQLSSRPPSSNRWLLGDLVGAVEVLTDNLRPVYNSLFPFVFIVKRHSDPYGNEGRICSKLFFFRIQKYQSTLVFSKKN